MMLTGLWRRLRALLAPPYACPVCLGRVRRFRPLPEAYVEALDRYGFVHSLFQLETLNVQHYECPRCAASDRDRLYALFLGPKHAQIAAGAKVRLLELGPGAALSQFIRSLPRFAYRSADLMNPAADDVVDIMDMRQYAADAFDAFLCSHVLEHVADDRRALRELFRVLAPDGWGIVMAPIHLGLERTLEEPAHVTEAERWKFYGQGDHVRLYAKADFTRRVGDVGFAVRELGVEYFGAGSFVRHGIHPRSVLYLVEKRSGRP